MYSHADDSDVLRGGRRRFRVCRGRSAAPPAGTSQHQARESDRWFERRTDDGGVATAPDTVGRPRVGGHGCGHPGRSRCGVPGATPRSVGSGCRAIGRRDPRHRLRGRLPAPGQRCVGEVLRLSACRDVALRAPRTPRPAQRGVRGAPHCGPRVLPHHLDPGPRPGARCRTDRTGRRGRRGERHLRGWQVTEGEPAGQ